MANLMKAVPKSATRLPAREDALEGARRATGDVSSRARPADPEVVAIARRRRISASEKLRILAAADLCTEPGEIGALMRREGIYSSQLSAWRRLRANKGVSGMGTVKRGRKADPAIAEAHRVDKLTRDNDRLRRQLAQAHLIIDVQKKVSALLSLQTADLWPDQS
jgi:transposase